MQIFSLILVITLLNFNYAVAQNETKSLNEWCVQSLNKYKSYLKNPDLAKACESVIQNEGCTSAKGKPIYHMDRAARIANAKKILVISLIHGDETGAGSLGRYWLERLQTIDPRNNWRVIPVANPDGVELNTRMNANGVDLNRNFPTKDWDEKAKNFWKQESNSSPRRFPGEKAGSEPEVKCLVSHLKSYQPDFVISIHTPLNVLDFDGPTVKPPKYSYLPWRRLGNFPGSLGRFMWVENETPVLTAELKPTLPATSGVFEQLQDVIGELVKYQIK